MGAVAGGTLLSSSLAVGDSASSCLQEQSECSLAEVLGAEVMSGVVEPEEPLAVGELRAMALVRKSV